VHETIRHALNELALQAAIWLKQQVTAEWFERYSQQTSSYLLPKKESERQAWAEQVGRDGIWLLEHLYHDAQAAELVKLPAVTVLWQVWLQNFYQEDGQVRLREPKDQPPSAQRIASLRCRSTLQHQT
jgi:transposase